MAVTSPILDILILDTHNIGNLAVADNSVYPANFTIISPSIEIIPPSYPISTKVFTPSSLNVFNSNDIGITCLDQTCTLCELPDGYWQLKYTISPAQTYFVTKSFMRTNILQRMFGQVFLSLDLDKCDETVREQDMKKLDQINSYIQTSIAAANECNAKLAIDLYNIANKMLKEFLNNKCHGNLQRVW